MNPLKAKPISKADLIICVEQNPSCFPDHTALLKLIEETRFASIQISTARIDQMSATISQEMFHIVIHIVVMQLQLL